MNDDNRTYFDSLRDDIPKEIKKFIDNKNIATDIYRMQANNSLMWGYFRIQFFLTL